jgi:hypothetical protein
LTRQHLVVAIEQPAFGPRSAHVLNSDAARWSEEDSLTCVWALSELMELHAAARGRLAGDSLVVYRLELVTGSRGPVARPLDLSSEPCDWPQSIGAVSIPNLFH